MPTPSSWAGTPSIRGSTEAARMALLTFSLIGLQFTWGIEMTYCTPYLLQLGLSKSRTSLVWIAGPLSGLIMQPLVGALADRSTSRYGRRRPVMVICSGLVGACLLLLGWTGEVVGMFVGHEESAKKATVVVAVLAIYAVDFAINAVQACCRSLIVDTLPISQQQLGSAWAARMAASGNIVGYLIGTVDLVTLLPTWMGGDTQFKKMTVISTAGLWIAIGITSYAVTERRLLSPALDERRESVFSILSTLWYRTIRLPPRIQAICWTQFWAWIGWFPFLFYSSTWVGEMYYRYEHVPSAPDSPDTHDALGNIGRLGSLALVIFSFITFTSSVILPYLVKDPASDISHLEKFTPRPSALFPKSLQTVLAKFPSEKPSLVTSWLVSSLLFAAIFLFAPAVHSVRSATIVVALAGIPWAVTCWAPFSEMGVEINRLSSSNPPSLDSAMLHAGGYTAVRSSIDFGNNNDDQVEMSQHRRMPSDGSTTLRIYHPASPTGISDGSTGELAGVYLGVLNVYTTLPQFVGTFVSWIVFSVLEPDKSADADDVDPNHHSKWLDLRENAPNAIAVCLFIGALCAIGAAEAARRLRRMA